MTVEFVASHKGYPHAPHRRHDSGFGLEAVHQQQREARMAIELQGVQIGAQHRKGKPDEWLVTYSIDGRGRYIHRVVDSSVQDSRDAMEVARRELGVR
jgi:hypothetical protein